jgi:hypothetical protein
MIKTTKNKTVKTDVWISRDNKEFLSEVECRKHEKELEVRDFEAKKAYEIIKHFHVSSAKNLIPLRHDEDCEEYTNWYYCPNEYVWSLLQKAFPMADVPMASPKKYPTYICCDNTHGNFDEHEEMTGYSFIDNSAFEDSVNRVKWFFAKFGIDVEFKSRT